MTTTRSPWLVPAALVLFSVIPALGGIARFAETTSATEITPENARFLADPVPVLIHIPATLVYSVLGAFQFTPALRRRNRWHKVAGRILLPTALIVAITGLWMTLTYPWPDHDGLGVYLERLVFGTAMLVSVVMGIDTIRRRKFAEHGEWMIRAYALGMGAGTQVLTHVPWFILVDLHPGRLPRTIMMGSAWVINALVAEWIIRRSRASTSAVRRPSPRQHAQVPSPVSFAALES